MTASLKSSTNLVSSNRNDKNIYLDNGLVPIVGIKTHSFVSIITPDVAKKIVEKTDGYLQRVSSIARIKEYSELMKNGRWVLNYEPIIIGEFGNALNGLHRLKACVLANTPFSTLIVCAISECDFYNVFATTDKGKARTNGDALSAKGTKYYNAISACITRLKHFQNENYGVAASLNGGYSSSKNKGRLSHFEIDSFLDKNPHFEEFIGESLKIRSQRTAKINLINESVFNALYYICSIHNKQKAGSFFIQIITGSNTDKSSPISFCRDRLLEYMTMKTKISSSLIANTILICFDYYCEGKTVNSHIKILKEAYKLKTQMNMF